MVKRTPRHITNIYDTLSVCLVIVVSVWFLWVVVRRGKSQHKMDAYLQTENFHFDGVNNCENTTTPYSIIFFYMETCPHCIDFKPIWQKFVDTIRNSRFSRQLCISDVSAENDNLIEKYSITTFPTILLVNNNSDDSGMPIQFEGQRTTEGLMTFVSQNVV